MRARYLASAGVALSVILGMSVASGPALGQGRSAAAAKKDSKAWLAPKTPWGEPDLQGVWRSEGPPLERSDSFKGREFLTDEEIAARQKAENEQVAKGLEAAENARPDLAVSPIQGNEYNRFWGYTGKARKVPRRTSMIIDPPNGKLPLKKELDQMQQFHAAYVSNFPPEEHYDNTWMDRDTGERCLTDGLLGQMWGGTGPNLFVQGPGYIVMQHEQFRDRRIIPTNGHPVTGPAMWHGTSVGHWEGDTLVVETTNFLDKLDNSWQSYLSASSKSQKLVERWTRTGPHELNYKVTVTDPAKFSAPWTAETPMTDLSVPNKQVFFEYACAEGNYGIIHTLSGTRGQEKEHPELKSKKTEPQKWIQKHYKPRGEMTQSPRD